MRLYLHDYSGHPFQVQLSRELASRGHQVVHGYSTQYVTGHGRLVVGPEDPATLRIEGITCDRELIKYSPVGRTRFELAYAEALIARVEQEQFDLVIACNIPLFALARVRRHFARTGQAWALWHQDIYSMAIAAEADRRLPAPAAAYVSRMVERIEKRQLIEADAVIAITESMVTCYGEWGIERDGVHVMPNWAPLNDIVPGPRDNAWSRDNGLAEGPTRLIYAGTLGRKHNPLLLLEMLDAARDRGQDVELIVASEGDGADQLAATAGNRSDVRFVGYQPADRFSDMLASADAVVALLEPDAAKFSVPSKVLSYLSAGKAIIGLVPLDNPAAADIAASGGFVASPSVDGARAAAEWLGEVGADRARLADIGSAARAMAETRFDIAHIGDGFERIFARACNMPVTVNVVPVTFGRDSLHAVKKAAVG